ncbi:MAG TPA: hypothetical protein VI757_08385 [Bacteroidia bacterium]|nr:hypothetical protein [Bacteroidia bacterium]
MKKNSGLLLPFLLMIGIYSCKKDSVIAPYSLSYNYIPTDTGRWIIYDVDSTFYDDFYNPSVITNYTYQVIERIDSVYTDSMGRPTQRLERMKRDSANVPWDNYFTIWTSNLTSARYEKVEENYRYIKLGFPITETQSWNGNAFNPLGYSEYFYEAIHVPMSLASFAFDSVIVVFQGTTGIITEEKNGREIFKNHIGLVKKEFNDVRIDLTNPNRPGGVRYTYTINQYGLHNAPMPLEN